MEQEGIGDDARVIFITHVTREAAIQAALREFRDLEVIHAVNSVLRVLGDGTSS